MRKTNFADGWLLTAGGYFDRREKNNGKKSRKKGKGRYK